MLRHILLFGSAVATVCVQSRAIATPPANLPYEHSDCFVRFTDAEALLGSFDSDEFLGQLFGLLGGPDAAQMFGCACFADDSGLRSALEKGGIFLAEYRDQEQPSDWVAWVDLESDVERGRLLKELNPVLESDRFVVPELSISLHQTDEGLLVSPEPPGALLGHALAGGHADAKAFVFKHAAPTDAPMSAWFRNAADIGGTSVVSMRRLNGFLEISFEARALTDPIVSSTDSRNLDVEVLDRLPDDIIMAMVEHTAVDLIPGERVISSLLPYLIEPEPSDERRARRLVVVSETALAGQESVRLPAVAVAIEVDGPGASSRRQDLQVLASLNSLRNRLGAKAGLQHLPTPDEFEKDGARTIYTKALFGPAFEGHPMAECLSVNWCQTSGDARWQLYATNQTLANQLTECLSHAPEHATCVDASHAGRLDADRAVDHVRTWGNLANVFIGEAGTKDFSMALDLFAGLLRNVDYVDWEIVVPEARSVNAVIRLHGSHEAGADD